MAKPDVTLLRVFSAGEGGGNPCPVVLDADSLSAAEMQAVAAAHGHESGFALAATDSNLADVRFRFFVPEHEMEMCGHATLGTAWLMRGQGRAPAPVLRIETVSGIVRAIFGGDGSVEITQPAGRVAPVEATGAVLSALGLSEADLAPGVPVLNAATSRVKTLVPLADAERLHALRPGTEAVREACAAIGSTGLYPWVEGEPGQRTRTVHARQFPRQSGYVEDAATGIAAAALFYGLDAPAAGLVVRQGEAMGRPSEIRVRRDPEGDGCRIGGSVAIVR